MKYQIMINSIRLRLLPEINKIPECYTIFARKMLDYIIRQRNRGQAEVKCLRPRPGPKFWPRGGEALEDLTSLLVSISSLYYSNYVSLTPKVYRLLKPLR